MATSSDSINSESPQSQNFQKLSAQPKVFRLGVEMLTVVEWLIPGRDEDDACRVFGDDGMLGNGRRIVSVIENDDQQACLNTPESIEMEWWNTNLLRLNGLLTAHWTDGIADEDAVEGLCSNMREQKRGDALKWQQIARLYEENKSLIGIYDDYKAQSLRSALIRWGHEMVGNIRRPNKQMPASCWRSIKSAPTDGTRVIISGGGTMRDGEYVKTGVVYDARYWTDDEASSAGWHAMIIGKWRMFEPTHWQPMLQGVDGVLS